MSHEPQTPINTPREQTEQKQSQDRDREPRNVQQDGYNAEELAQASIYDDSTQMAQQMRRGDEAGESGNDRDVVGAVPPEHMAPEASADTAKAENERNR